MSKVEVKKLAAIAGHRDCIYTIVPGGEPHLFYSGAGDGMVAMWDLRAPADGHLIARMDNSIYSLCLLKEANLLVVGHNYEGLHFIDSVAKKEAASLKLNDAPIFDIQQYKNLLFVATGNGEVIVIDWQQVKILQRLKLSDKSARAIAINPVERHIAIGYSDNSVRIVDLASLEVTHTISSHTNSVFVARYSPDYKYLLTGGRDAHLRVWEVEHGYSYYQSIVAHMYAINHIDYSPSGNHFATGSMDKSIKIWDAQSFQLLKVIDRARHAGHGTSVNKLLWSSFDDQLISASDDRTISVWDVKFKAFDFE